MLHRRLSPSAVDLERNGKGCGGTRREAVSGRVRMEEREGDIIYILIKINK